MLASTNVFNTGFFFFFFFNEKSHVVVHAQTTF